MSQRNISRKLEQIKPGTLHCGVDLSLESNVAVVIDEHARQISRFKFPHTSDGYGYFQKRIRELRERFDASEVIVAMEPTNYFWKLLANELEQKGGRYCLVNAYTVKKHREGDQLDRSKDDRRDAFTIADLSRTGKYTETRLQHEKYAEMREYAVLHDRLQAQIRREKNRLWQATMQAFPEINEIFRELTGETCKAMLRTHATAWEIRKMDEENFIADVRAACESKRLMVKKLRTAYCLANTSIGLSDGVEAIQLSIRTHLEALEMFQKNLDRNREALLACFLSLPEAKYLLSIKGLGAITAAIILAEIGDPSRYRNARQLVKLAGIQPTPNKSGRKQHSATPISKQGRPRLRTALFFACLRLSQRDATFATKYQQLQKRKKNPLTKMQALVVLMKKLLHVMWSLIRQQTFYNPTLLQEA